MDIQSFINKLKQKGGKKPIPKPCANDNDKNTS